MAKKSNHLADFEADDAGGGLSGLLAEENELDGRTLWRIASWGVGATGAVVLAVMANQSSFGVRRDQVASADLSRQAQQIQTVARETQNEARRLSAAIETLNGDRDRLYARVTSLEQGLDSVTGTVSRQGPASAPPAHAEPQAGQNAPPVPYLAPLAMAAPPVPDKPVVTAAVAEPVAAMSSPAREAARNETAKADKPETSKADRSKSEAGKSEAKAELAKPEPAKPSPATPLISAQSMMAPPDPAASKLIEPGKNPPAVIMSSIPDVTADADADETAAPKVSLQRTEFGVDLGTANSVNGLRALWRGLLKSRSNAPLVPLRPIIVIKESTTGLGMQLRLVAGPLNDAGAAARICAVLVENNRPCETAVFDGQRLSLKADDLPATTAKPTLRRRGVAKRAATVVDEAKKPDPPKPGPQAALTTLFGRKNQQ